MQNSEVARILFEISEYLDMAEVAFKPRAYEKAANAVADLEDGVAEIYKRDGLGGLKEIPGVGASIAEKIEELIKTGHLKYYESLKKETPIKLDELTRIEGLGPKMVKQLHEKLGIKNSKDLEKAAREGEIRNIEGFGEKTEQNILDGIAFQKQYSGRFLFGYITPLAETLKTRLGGLKDVSKIAIAGSYRRRKETVGDLDVLVVAKESGEIMDYFVSQPEVVKVLAHGPTKSSVHLENGIDVDIRVIPPESYGAALAYFTGSKAHNIRMREIAQKKGMKLNEYGLYKGKKRVAGKTEEEIYGALELDYVEPEMRERLGEIELAKKGELPKLVEYGSVKGDLQVQSDWTDGANSIEELTKAAVKAGLEYIAITDHTKSLAMTGGLDEKKIRRQMAEIDKLNKKLKGKMRILKGTECDILKDGTLDLPDSVLKNLEVVGVSVHSFFNLSRKEQTERVMRAIKNPHADIFFHPTGRRIQRRKAIEIDIDEVIKTAKETGTVMEINSMPDRLDLRDENIRKCVEAGVKMSISSDAHSTVHFNYLNLGVAQARRGWATKGDIINAWRIEKCLSFLKHG